MPKKDAKPELKAKETRRQMQKKEAEPKMKAERETKTNASMQKEVNLRVRHSA